MSSPNLTYSPKPLDIININNSKNYNNNNINNNINNDNDIKNDIIPQTASFSASNYSFALSIISSSSSAALKKSVKNSPEYRALRQQLFQLQSTHNSLKLSHEREGILFSTQRSQFQEKIQKLQEQLDEIKKDQVFLFNSEQTALKDFENIKTEKEQQEQSFKSRFCELEKIISDEKEARYAAESAVSNLKLQLQLQERQCAPGYTEEFVSNLLGEWKERVMILNSKNKILEEELKDIKEQKLNFKTNETSSENCESLRQKILSTYTSLESAQSSLSQKKNEIERLSARIGNIKILEEKFRDAQIIIKRLENELSMKHRIISDNSNDNFRDNKDLSSSLKSSHSNSSSATDLKLIQLTQELGTLKENLAVAHYTQSTLQQDLLNCNKTVEILQNDLDDSRRTIQKLQNSLKVKENTIVGLKEQLDSTVNLLTETLKKKK